MKRMIVKENYNIDIQTKLKNEVKLSLLFKLSNMLLNNKLISKDEYEKLNELNKKSLSSDSFV